MYLYPAWSVTLGEHATWEEPNLEQQDCLLGLLATAFLVEDGEGTWLLANPPAGDGGWEPAVDKNSGPNVRLRLGFSDDFTGSLLYALRSARLPEARGMIDSLLKRAEDGRPLCVLQRVAGAYAILMQGLFEYVVRLETLIKPLPDSPDRTAIEGEWLAWMGRHSEALERFSRLPLAGFPSFQEGLSSAVDRLTDYQKLRCLGPEEHARAGEALTRLEPLMPLMDFQCPVVALRWPQRLEPVTLINQPLLL